MKYVSIDGAVKRKAMQGALRRKTYHCQLCDKVFIKQCASMWHFTLYRKVKKIRKCNICGKVLLVVLGLTDLH